MESTKASRARRSPPPFHPLHRTRGRRVYRARRQSLATFLTPCSVALIGASENPGGIGHAVLENVRGFSGRVLPINSTDVNVLGRAALPTIAEVTDPVDLAVIVMPARTIPEIVRDCVEAVVGAARIIAAGFKECGPSGAALEH